MQHDDDKLTEVIDNLRRRCTEKNYRHVHIQIQAAVRTDQQERFEENPNAYVAAPVCYWPPGMPPDEIDIFWGIYAPGPYEGVNGATERRPVVTGMVVHHPAGMPGSVLRGHPNVDVLPHSMCFMDGEDAISFARMMSLSNDMHLAKKMHKSVEELKSGK